MNHSIREAPNNNTSVGYTFKENNAPYSRALLSRRALCYCSTIDPDATSSSSLPCWRILGKIQSMQDGCKDPSKEDSKEDFKEDFKEDSKGLSKDLSKGLSKEDSKEDSKDLL
jgi:hypothetical protein